MGVIGCGRKPSSSMLTEWQASLACGGRVFFIYCKIPPHEGRIFPPEFLKFHIIILGCWYIGIWYPNLDCVDSASGQGVYNIVRDSLQVSLIVQDYSDIADTWHCWHSNQQSAFLVKVWTKGWWSMCTTNCCPSSICWKCQVAQWTVSNSVEHRSIFVQLPIAFCWRMPTNDDLRLCSVQVLCPLLCYWHLHQ